MNMLQPTRPLSLASGAGLPLHSKLHFLILPAYAKMLARGKTRKPAKVFKSAPVVDSEAEEDSENVQEDDAGQYIS